MLFHQQASEIFVPDGLPAEEALARTTHMAIAAHQDDIEIMAATPIITCFQQPHLWFTGVVVSDGRGSPRDDLYKNFNDEEMRLVRFKEQKKAAIVGEYAAQVMLDFPSKVIKDGANPTTVADLASLLRASRPTEVYTHNLADKHETHVAVALRVVAAIRSLPAEERPQKLYGCEVWRNLDWMMDSDKVQQDLTSHENLQAALLGVFVSQICGGKRYDLAAMGRRRANATFFESHGVDQSLAMAYAMDLTPLITDPDKDPASFVQEFIQRFTNDVAARLQRLG
jgi:LmbE family N-acetylglucosaminyl deacetylase